MTPTDHDIAEVAINSMQPRWASTDDPVGDIAIRLAAHASAVEEEEGEWAWRDLAKLVAEMLATRPQPTDEMCKAIESLGDLLSGSIDVSGTALILSNDSADARVMIQRARDAYDAAESALAAMGEAR